MEYIPGELMPLEKNQSQIWVGNSEGVITVFDESMKKIDSVQTSSAMIICLLLVGDAVWAVFSNTELKILPVRVCIFNFTSSLVIIITKNIDTK